MATDTFTLEPIPVEIVYSSISLSACQNISSSSLIFCTTAAPKNLGTKQGSFEQTGLDSTCSQELMCRENKSPNIASAT